MASIPAIQIIGAGPAGSAAAIAARSESRAVEIFDRALAPRHKVCGEFISPEACPLLDQLGVWGGFLGLGPSRIRRCRLHFGARVKQWILPDTAFGLSRLALDTLLLRRAESLGAVVSRGATLQGAASECGGPLVVASGRRPPPAARPRLFGFKAHFEGPADDAVELYFSRSGYIGINPVENNLTNVCGIAPEDILRACGFQIDELLRTESVAERLKPLSRRMPWLTTGPLLISRPSRCAPSHYLAGDALGFVDPFTGSGILNALLTGRMAGSSAARQVPVEQYVTACRSLLRRPAAVSAFLRAVLQWDFAGELARLVPGRWIYGLTRI